MRKGRLLRTLALLAIVAMVVPTSLVACGTKVTPTPTPKPVVLKIMDNWGLQSDAKGPPLHSIIEDFKAAYPYITVEEEVFTDVEIPTKVETAFLAKEEPDLVFQNLSGASQDWTKDGLTVDVKDMAKSWGLYDTFNADALQQWTDDQGRLRGFPLEGFSYCVWYNTKILKEAGVEIPKTTDELFAAAPKIKAAGYDVITSGGADFMGQWDFYFFVSAAIPNDEAVKLYREGGWGQSANARKGVELFVKMRDAGLFPKDVEGLQYDAGRQLYFSGKAAIMHEGSWGFAECPDDVRANTVIGGFPLPAGSPHKAPIHNAGYIGKAIWVTRNGAEKMDAVEKFVKFFFQGPMIARFVEQAGMVSPLKTTPVNEGNLNSLLVQILKAGDSVTNAEVLDTYVPAKIFEDFLKVANEAFLPGVSVDKILASLDAVYKNLD